MIESISAITLATHNMSRAVRFYRMLGFEIVYGGDDAAFTGLRIAFHSLSEIS
jgi:catechol-2,3-dioxygenase